MRRRLAYLGTPEPAVAPLRALVDAGHDVVVVVTRPDRRRARGPTTSPSPVKAEAERLGIPVAHGYDALVEASPELGVVVAYGRIIPVSVLERVPMVNLHFSLLPRWRGAAPVERAILAGDETTGVCVMAVEEGLDTGPVYARREVAIEPGETLRHLRDRLVGIGCDLLVRTLSGPLPDPEPQAGEATYAAKLGPGDLELHLDRPAAELARVVRVGGAWTTWRGRRLKVVAAEPVAAGPGSPGVAPGTLVGDTVLTGEGALRLLEVQPEGRSAMEGAAWVRGARPAPGERLGS